MNHADSAPISLRLLSHRPLEMAAWWSALLGESPKPFGAKTTVVTSARLRVVIEGSQNALDYHPEACGVTAITLVYGALEDIRETVRRLGQQNAHPYRATRQGGVTALWFHDPNGTDVALCRAVDDVHLEVNPDEWPEELDPDAVLADKQPPH
ncbi:hypothetical protein [Mycobacterium sp. 050134]|uniref:hypothetical protein n=1 Tax=Mycobacterium sp. 050134 TaxID=3096111 RepID=UPI002ED92B8C